MQPRGRVARNLRRLRVKAGLTQLALALEAGLESVHVSRIELDRANPTLNVLTRIAKALRADIVELFVDVPAGEPRAKNLRRGRKQKKSRQTATKKSQRPSAEKIPLVGQ